MSNLKSNQTRIAALRRHLINATFSSESAFTPDFFRDPVIPHGLKVVDVPIELATDESLAGFGRLVHSAEEFTVDRGNFEIVPWPRPPGSRPLDPHTGDEGGTTEGDFNVRWQGDYFLGKNLAIASVNNTYVDGLGTMPEAASRNDAQATSDGNSILLWMTDYHPDGAQLFWPYEPIPFVVCLGPASCGDNIKPENMRAFYIPAGK